MKISVTMKAEVQEGWVTPEDCKGTVTALLSVVAALIIDEINHSEKGTLLHSQLEEELALWETLFANVQVDVSHEP